MFSVVVSGHSATSSPAMLGIRRLSYNHQRAQSSMQLDTYYGDNSLQNHQRAGHNVADSLHKTANLVLVISRY